MDSIAFEECIRRAEAEAARSSLFDARLEEVSESVRRAVERAPPARAGEARVWGADLLARTALGHHRLSSKRFLDFLMSEEAWGQYVDRCAAVVRALERAHALDPRNSSPLEKVVEICSELVKGVPYTAVGDYWIAREKEHRIVDRYASELRAKIEACAGEIRKSKPDYVPPLVPAPPRCRR